MTRRILLVDDEPDILSATAAYLTASLPDVEVATAERGADALRMADDESFDLAIVDYRMPGMSGLEVLEALRLHHPEITTIMLTAYPDQDLAVEAVNRGRVRQFLTKPVDPTQLADVVGWLLSDARRSRLRDQAFRRASKLGASR